MTKVISLFSNQESAGEAVKALTEAGYEDAETYSIDDWDDIDRSEPVVPPIHSGHATASVSIPPIKTIFPDLNLDDEVERFFMRSLKDGGMLVMIELSNGEKIQQAQEILEEKGGQVTW